MLSYIRPRGVLITLQRHPYITGRIDVMIWIRMNYQSTRTAYLHKFLKNMSKRQHLAIKKSISQILIWDFRNLANLIELLSSSWREICEDLSNIRE